MFISFGALDLT